ncbi:hypothetical protein CMI37_12390 [Candidatus Pacearchaeota archaeon]|nr:hypothetical protein [Candidatus Pacearchaeota archaeon]|tara:strand:+ start:5845 stop:6486 length:642 start_codon:yes stop_codon:yes gene_type:complete
MRKEPASQQERKSFYLAPVRYRLEAELVRRVSIGEDIDNFIIPYKVLSESQGVSGHIPKKQLINLIRLPGIIIPTDLENWAYLFKTPHWHDDFCLPRVAGGHTGLTAEECKEVIELCKDYERTTYGGSYRCFGNPTDFTIKALEDPKRFFRFQFLRLKNGRMSWDSIVVEQKQEEIFNHSDNPENPFSDWNKSLYAYRQALAKYYADEIKDFN